MPVYQPGKPRHQQTRFSCCRASGRVPVPALKRSRRRARSSLDTDLQRKGGLMAMPINDAAFEYLLARAGLSLTDAEKTELKTVCDGIPAMAERVRKPRGRMTEPA